MSDVICVAVPVAQLEAVWPVVCDDLDRAIAYARGEMDVDDLKACIESGEMLLLMFFREDEYLAAVVAELADKPKLRMCNIVAAGGRDMDAWLDAWWEHIERIAKEQGADAIYVAGRKGWARALSKYGFETAYTVMARAI